MTIGTGVITGVSVAHQRADLAAIETASADGQRAVTRSLLTDGSVREAFTLQTCNRAEAFVVTESAETGHAALAHTVAGVPADAVRWLGHEDSLRHLMRVACGLESLVLGEDQIMGQLRTAYTDARSVGGIDAVLDEAVTKAIHVGERARTETAINEGAVSLGSAAVRLARRELGDIDERSVLVVGAGEMGSLAATAFADVAGELVVANRTVSHAEHVVSTLDVPGGGIGLDDLPAAVAAADIVVTATGSPAPVVDRETLGAAGDTLCIDLGQPRDVAREAARLPAVSVFDLDDLEDLTDATAERRREAAGVVERMIDEELDNLLTQFKRKRADAVIAAMYESAEAVKRREVETATDRLLAKQEGGVTDEQREVIEALADALVGQLLAAPTRSLRDAAEEDDWDTINAALQLFDPEFDDAPTLPGTAAPVETDLEDLPPELRERVPDGVLDRLGDD